MVYRASIVSCRGAPVQRIVLRMPEAFSFRAGQYLEVCHPEGSVPLSIASAPHRLPELHLHYRATPGAVEAGWMDQLLAAGGDLDIQGPGGTVARPEGTRSVLLVAAGTGMAQAASLLDDAFANADRHAAWTLLWCADRADDFYLREELARYRGLETVLIADPERSDDNRALVWLRESAPRIAAAGDAVVIAGAPPFVYAATDELLAGGVAPDAIQSDVFSYAPRD